MVVNIFLLSLIFFSSCSSFKLKKTEIEPFYLLTPNADLYISIPVSGNKDILNEMLQLTLVDPEQADNSLSKKSFDTFFKRTDRICIAYNFDSDNLSPSFEAILQGNYPFFTSNILFTKKNGFYKKSFEGEDTNNYNYWYNINTNIQTSLPNSQTIFVSSNSIASLQKNLINYKENIFSDTSKLQRFTNNQIDFLNNPTDITMFIMEPGNLVPQLLGAKAIKLAIDNALISFKPLYTIDTVNKDESTVSDYNITVNLDMTNTQAQGLGYILLNLAKKTNSFTVDKIGTKKLIIKDYILSTDDILKLLK
ncbi:MAG: hypothetical protein BKP49_09115 [Treponema sp. CETP13]|nr:MAG: hypothetical protein BKP49_09115 [Treponema sp. CETP13]